MDGMGWDGMDDVKSFHRKFSGFYPLSGTPWQFRGIGVEVFHDLQLRFNLILSSKFHFLSLCRIPSRFLAFHLLEVR